MKSFWLTIKEIVEVVVISLVTVFIIRSFIVQPFLVSGASMEPMFQDGNYLLVDEITYLFREPRRGEVIVFRYPRDPSVFYIKRIIGLPNEHIVIKENKVYINGKELKENYINNFTTGRVDFYLQDNEYFVMGDNRAHSFDSRSWGPINRDDIVGIPRLRVLPLKELGLLKYSN